MYSKGYHYNALPNQDSLHECTLAIKDTMGQYFAWPFLAPVDKKEVRICDNVRISARTTLRIYK